MKKSMFFISAAVAMLGAAALSSQSGAAPEGFVRIEAGAFQMGGAGQEDNPAHGVTLTRDFYVCDHEVTQAEYEAVVSDENRSFRKFDDALNPSYHASYPADGESQENRPVENVGWYDAIAYCNFRSMDEGLTPCYTINGSTNPADWPSFLHDEGAWDAALCDFDADGYRLPTEAEWEYAARGGESHAYAGSDEIGEVAWYDGNSRVPIGWRMTEPVTREVKGKKANGRGLYDMSGNVWEWCWDWYGGMSAEAASDPTGAAVAPVKGFIFKTRRRVLRGGSFASGAKECAVTYRDKDCPGNRYGSFGFRVVRTAR